ncbi:hypothetical protein M8818_000531 [Zalaria obscura]|uniref:Uncharacterized protein n=1 Tax=Zalaria obscura TaxID=2024903 RepID=A0ACC3SPT5_9PEZI
MLLPQAKSSPSLVVPPSKCIHTGIGTAASDGVVGISCIRSRQLGSEKGRRDMESIDTQKTHKTSSCSNLL